MEALALIVLLVSLPLTVWITTFTIWLADQSWWVIVPSIAVIAVLLGFVVPNLKVLGGIVSVLGFFVSVHLYGGRQFPSFVTLMIGLILIIVPNTNSYWVVTSAAFLLLWIGVSVKKYGVYETDPFERKHFHSK